MRYSQYILYCFCTAFLLLLVSCGNKNEQPVAKKGVLDISALNIERESLIKLDGDWEFYWQQLYEPNDFAAGNTVAPAYIKVPVFWNTQIINGKKLPPFGYATYRLKIKKTVAGGPLGIKLPDPNSAYKLWVNGQLVAAAGRPGRNAKEEDPRLYPAVVLFSGNEAELDVVLQVSNFFHHKAGVWQSIQIGTEKDILEEHEGSLLLDMCLVGAFFILAVYNLFIFFLRRSEYSALIFSFLSLCFSFRTLFIGERPILLFIPDITTDVLHRIQYESLFAACMFFMGFVYTITYRVFPRKVLNFFIWLSVVELCIICFTPVRFYTSLLIVFQLKVFVQAIFNYYAIVKSIQIKTRRAWLLFLLLSFIFVSGINDVLFTNAIIHTGYQMQYSSFLILLAQAYIVATRISGTFFKFSRLSNELHDANRDLEIKVAERTMQLETEKDKANKLLLNILPAKVAAELKTGGHPVPQRYDMASIMLIDMVGFTKVSEQVSAELLIAEIDECFKAFDAIIENHNIEKIKTIGDAYLCAGGLPEPNTSHAEDVVKAAIEINDFMQEHYKRKEMNNEVSFRIRTGIHSGPVVAGIVGGKNFSYDVWGGTVDIAGQMEQNCEAGKINISEATMQHLKGNFNYLWHSDIAIEEGGTLKMFFVETSVIPAL